MSEHSRASVAVFVGLLLAMMLAGYVVAYYATVERAILNQGNRPQIFEPDYPALTNCQSDPTSPRYRFWASTFAPMHKLDRKLRPRTWDRWWESDR